VSDPARPSLDEFFAAPVENVAAVAPHAILYVPGGTRRQAVFAGIPADGEEWARWSQERMFAFTELVFQYGVRHFFMMVAPPEQFRETTSNYREHLWRWFDWGLAGPEALEVYRRLGWRVRILFSDQIPQLNAAGARLQAAEAQQNAPTLWYGVIPDYDLPWRCMVDAINRSQEKTRAEAARILYGESIPPISLYLGNGKPVLSLSWFPPFLADQGKFQCYWLQRPGYSLDEKQIRMIIYDYAYLRQTWQPDKTGRAQQAYAYRQAWEQAGIIGMGTQLGGYWFPAPFTPPEIPAG
jgi:hypothetical protein